MILIKEISSSNMSININFLSFYIGKYIYYLDDNKEIYDYTNIDGGIIRKEICRKFNKYHL